MIRKNIFSFLVSFLITGASDKLWADQVLDDLKARVKSDFKTGRAQKTISNVKKIAQKERSMFKKISNNLAKSNLLTLKVGRNLKDIDFSSISWSSIYFKKGTGEKCLYMGRMRKSESKFFVEIESVPARASSSMTIGQIIHFNMVGILKCNKLQVTVSPKYPHRTTVVIDYDKNGKIIAHSKLRYWQ